MGKQQQVKIYNGEELKALLEKDPVLKATLQIAMTTTVQQAIKETEDRLQPYAQMWAAYMSHIRADHVDIPPIAMASVKRGDKLSWLRDERGGMRVFIKWSDKKIVVPR